MREIEKSEVKPSVWDEVEKDVARSLWWWSTNETDAKQKHQALRRVLLHTLRRGNGRWHYFQGLHELASVLMLVLGERDAVNMLEILATHKLNAWFQRGIEPIVDIICDVMPLLRIADPPLFQAIEASGVSPLFCIGWVITWFTHDVEDPQAAYVLLDALCGVVADDGAAERFVVYMCAAYISLVRDKVLALPPDQAVMHHFFTSEMPLLQASGDPGPKTSKSLVYEEKREVMDVYALLEQAYKLQSKWTWYDVAMSRQKYGRTPADILGGVPSRPKLPESAVKKRKELLKSKVAVPVVVGVVAVGVVSAVAAVMSSIPI